MAKADTNSTRPFSVDVVKQLAEVMSQHDLSEVALDTDGGRLRLRRGPRGVAVAMSAQAAVAHAPTPAAASVKPAESAAPSRKLLDVKSEAVGTFYARPNPQSEPYVKIGSKVSPGTPVGQIEAMKMFNEITAGVSGTIAEILVENEQPVEYGTVLFRVEAS